MVVVSAQPVAPVVTCVSGQPGGLVVQSRTAQGGTGAAMPPLKRLPSLTAQPPAAGAAKREAR